MIPGWEERADRIAELEAQVAAHPGILLDWTEALADAQARADAAEAQVAALTAACESALMSCSIDWHGGSDDYDCRLCNTLRAALQLAKSDAQQNGGAMTPEPNWELAYQQMSEAASELARERAAAIARADAAEAQVAALTAAVNWLLDNAEVWGEEHNHIAALVQR